MKNIFSYLSIAVISTLFYGCGVNSKANYIINPDLTCKCVFEEKAGLDVAIITNAYGGNILGGTDESKLSSIMGTDTSNPSPHEILLAFGSRILSNKSVEAWKDIDLHLIGNDTVYFKGTAYIKYVGTGGLSYLDTNMRVSTNEQGQTVIEMKQSSSDTSSRFTSQAYKNLFKGGAYMAMIHYYMASIMREYYTSVTYQVPGKIINSSNFVKINDNTAQLVMDGKQMMMYLDTLMTNTDIMTKMYSNPASLSSFTGSKQFEANKYMFGEAKPVRLVYLSNGKNQFDYAKEVAEAKRQFAAFKIKSGIAAYDSITKAKKEFAEEEKKKEEGILVLNKKDSANGKLYFKTLEANQYYRGYFTFTGELSKPITSTYLATISLTSLQSDKGSNILDSISNPTSISAYISPSLMTSNDTTEKYNRVSFSINGNFPDDCKFINLKGTLNVDSATIVPFNIINLNLSKKRLDYNGLDEKR